MDCAVTTLSLGKSAQNLRELRDHLAIVPAQSLSHHFQDSLLRPSFDDPEYRNDFAIWAKRELHDASLGERLGVIDPTDYSDLELLRQHLLDVIEDRLAETEVVPQAARGKEFHFLRSQFVIIHTGVSAHSPEALGALIPSLSTGAIFFHYIDARRRPPLRVDDFSAWLDDWGPRYSAIGARLARIDYHFLSLTQVRERIARCFFAVDPPEVAR
jgi:hypothetical protein